MQSRQIRKGVKKLKTNRTNLKGFLSRTVSRFEFIGDWPFKEDVVKIRCKNGLQCIVSIKGNDYALNGSAAVWCNLKTPHEAKKAVIGKSLEPFIKLAKEIV